MTEMLCFLGPAHEGNTYAIRYTGHLTGHGCAEMRSLCVVLLLPTAWLDSRP